MTEVIASFLRSWNDALDDTGRQMLKPYVVRVVGTRTTDADEQTRAWLATDWLVRTFAPAWLDLAGLTGDAVALRALPEMTSTDLARAATPIIESAKTNARAARAAAGAAAWAAAGAALAPTVKELQASALDLLDRMIDVGGRS